ncbi:MAG: T9SS type A sorting domain-containing protein, partial [Ferruginibacter sp.]|nr:T9SS type A sorting domain-containing protein [Ferruginibacter sp.]
NGTPTAQYVYNVKNNGIYLSTGIKLARSNDPKTLHTNNAYNFFNGSSVNSSLGLNEIISTNSLFLNTSAADPINWDYFPSANSSLIDRGQNLGFTKDFAGNPVPTVPNSGIYENEQTITPLSANSSAGMISCNGGSTSVVVTASGGTAPYTGTGTFTVNAGTYTYTVKDANGASASTSITVTQPTPIAISLNAGNILSYGGSTSITVNASGGTAPYSYSINNSTYQTSNVFNNIVAGNYTITVKDAANCNKSSSITINQPSSTLIASVSAGMIRCNGGSTSVVVTASGGSAPYTGIGTFTVNAGTYTYTVKDANGVSASTSITVTQPTPIAVSLNAGNILSYGGSTSITVNASGGTAPYSYSINNSTYQTSNVFNNIVAGNYTITVKDAANCNKSSSISINQPSSPLIASVSAGMISCNGGSTSVVVTASGGSAPYTGIGTFTVNAGTYSYTVKDANGVTDSKNIIITQPDILKVDVIISDTALSDGSRIANVIVSGGTGNYLYKLNGGDYTSNSIFQGLFAGDYTLIVKDQNGCAITTGFTITQKQGPSLEISTIFIKNVSCKRGNDGQLTINATGGSAPYQYSINNSDNYTANNNFNNLKSGYYKVFVKDLKNNVVDTSIYIKDGKRPCNKINQTNNYLRLNTNPNPTTSFFNLSIESDSDDNLLIDVMSFNGVKVYQYSGKKSHNIQFGQNLSRGVYILRVRQGANISTQKLIKL